MAKQQLKTFPCILFTSMLAITACQTKKQALTVTQAGTEQTVANKQSEETTPVTKGLFNVYQKGDRYYYDIPDSIINREMLVVTRFVKTPQGIDIPIQQYGGEKENEQVWRWERHKNQVLIRVENFAARADKTSSMYQALQNSNLDDILYAFDIKSPDDKGGVIIDVTDFYKGDIAAIGVSDDIKKEYKIGGLDSKRSYIDTIKTFPINIETQVVKTYNAAESPTDKSNASISFELNTSMLLLPVQGMKPRLFDQRVHYMSNDMIDYGINSQRAQVVAYIQRFRLEPKDTAAYERGELVEPKKPIVFYIDPATPPQWVPYLIEAVNDWQKAFEGAGFKNAIMGKRAPTKEEDPDFNTEDARYNVIRYFASDIPNAYGPHVIDPRTGEVIESHVGWYHNEMKDSYDWYFIQTAGANPLARRPTVTDAEMGELMRWTCTHEIGHTLGLPHNWESSYAYPVDSLRSKTFTDKHGTSASIMDYARFNYIAQPGDGVTQFTPKIGEYDLWAIKWGYTWFPGNKTSTQEKQMLDKWTNAKSGNPLYFFGEDFTNYDPRTQNEDLGDDAMKASTYGIANLKRILPNIEKWTYVKGQNLDQVKDLYNQVLDQYRRYIGHVTTNIGGMYGNFKTFDDSVKAYTFVPKSIQERAMKFLNAQVITTPYWLMDENELRDIDNGLIIDRIKTIQVGAINSLLSPSRMARMSNNQLQNDSKAYSVDDLFNDLRAAMLRDPNPDVFKRNLQRGYIARLQKLLTDDFAPDPNKSISKLAEHGYTPMDIELSDIRPMVKAELLRIEKQLPKGSNEMAITHYADLKQRINHALDNKQVK